MLTSSTCPRTLTESFEIVIPRTAYDAAVRRQLHDPNLYSIGRFRWQETLAGRQLLVDELETSSGIPTGASRPPLDSYLVLHVDSGQTKGTAEDLLKRVSPLRSHYAVGLVVQVGPPALWDACIYSPSGRTQPVDMVTIQGPTPLRLAREEFEPGSSPADSQRWSRTSGAVGEETFARVRRTRVDVIGAGRNGTLVASMLAALGVAQLRIIDVDVLESHNQIGTLGLDAEDIGRSKAEALARCLYRQRPDLTLFSWNKSLLDHEVQSDLRRRPTDLIVTSVDDDAARLAAWLLARSLLVPHLDVGSAITADNSEHQLLGDVRLFIPGRRQGCPVCVGGVGDLDDTLYALNAPAGALRRGDPTDWRAQRAGSLIGLNSLVVGSAMQLWLDYLSGRCRTSAWQRLRWRPGQGLQSDFASVESMADCRFCNSP
jgi:hypothetical protein